MDRQKILDKIKKCLRLAKSANEHEAAIALGQAQKMMAALGISEADVAASEASEARSRAGAAERPVIWEASLANLCGAAFGCEVIFDPGVAWARRPGAWSFIGCDTSPEICQYAFVVLIRQLRRARGVYIAAKLTRCKHSTKIRRADDFCKAWVWSVRKTVQAFAWTDAHRTAIAAFRRASGVQTTALESLNRAKKKKANSSDILAGLKSADGVRLDRPVGGDTREALT